MAESLVKRATDGGTLADPQVTQVAKRRRFNQGYKLRILAEADRCMQHGEIGRLLRREGLYSWHLKYFRQWRDTMSPESQKPASKKDTIAQLRNALARSQRENERLKLQLLKKDAMLDLQKKMAELFQSENNATIENEP